MKLEVFTSLTYQGAKKVVKKIPMEDVQALNEALEDHLTYMYTSINKFGEGSVSDVIVTEREYHIMMKGIKKLEIMNGYLLDKLNETFFMETTMEKDVDKKRKAC